MKTELIRAALQAREHAYAPYSGYQVGAALLARSGRIYTGCNVENASYGAAICAERVATVKAISEGERDFVMLAIVGDGSGPVTPCGICRQFLYEFNPELKLVLANLHGQVLESTLEQYLPNAFGPKWLDGK
ncbi:MAG: cytidine deaminase [Bacillota bacterium]|jgi:cytidine deaminase